MSVRFHSLRRGVAGVAAVTALAAWPGASRAQDPASLAQTGTNSLLSIFTESTPRVQLRARYEFADTNLNIPMKGAPELDDGVAYTARARVGLETAEYKGFQAYVEGEANQQFGPRRFNAAGIEGDPMRSLVADPESARISQAYLTYSAGPLDFKLGRQRLTLGNGVFVGEIDFRNNGQNFDALTVKSSPLPNLELFYGYVYNVQRLFGSNGDDRDFDSRSNLLQASYKVNDLLNVKAYGFLLDLKNKGKDANSTNTYGIILSGSRTVPSSFGNFIYDYNVEYATQKDAAGSARDYRADFYHVDVAATVPLGFKLGLGRESLGDRDGVGFANTLDVAFRDVFLVTPANGLVDNFASLGTILPKNILAEVQFHHFRSSSGSDDYGDHVQVIARREIRKNVAILGRLTTYRDADRGPASNMFPGFPADTFRYSVQIDFTLN